MAALLTGRFDVADGAFHWFRALWEAQPELPRKLYLAWDDGGLITEFDDAVAFGRVIDFQAPRQSFFNPGIAAAFLGRYAMATGTAQAAEIARELIRLSEGGTSPSTTGPTRCTSARSPGAPRSSSRLRRTAPWQS